MSHGAAEPRVSVIIPLHNMGALLARALDSVLAQSYPDWEAWVVDDGSTDDGPEIAGGYVSSHPTRFHFLQHAARVNRGVSAARNLALDRCRGDYVAFLDADDLWTQDKLERQVRVLDTHPVVGLVYSSAVPIGEDGAPWDGSEAESPVKLVRTANGERRVGYGPPNQAVDLFEEMVRHCCMVNSTVLVRRSALDRAGRFDESMRYCEDWLLYTCVARHSKCYFIDEPLVQYRIHSHHFSSSLVGDELARLRGVSVFLEKLPARLSDPDGKLRSILDASRSQLFGRILTRAEASWRRGERGQALAFVRFAYGRFPGRILSRRSGRLLKSIVWG